MTREQAKKNLVALGVEEPTDEQVTNYLNQHNGEVKKYQEDAEKWKKKLKRRRSCKPNLMVLSNRILPNWKGEESQRGSGKENGRFTEAAYNFRSRSDFRKSKPFRRGVFRDDWRIIRA